ncbi:MAG: sigma 54-interacting transcriptional regulator [Vicinamibacterales bacterium]
MAEFTLDVSARSIETALIDAARSLTSRLDVSSVCTALLDAVQEVFGATSSWVLLHVEDEDVLRPAAFRGPGADAFRDVPMPADAGIMGKAFTSQRVVFVAQADDDDRWFDVARVHRTGMRSAFAVPLIGNGRTLGVVGLDTPRFSSEHPPEPVDIARLEALAAQAGVAVANAQLYEASERDRLRLTALLEERRGLRRRVAHLQEEVLAARPVTELIGDCPAWADTVRLADVVAAGATTVMLLGETGTGKELLARRIHEQSPRAVGPFVAVNCAALPESLVESELFGHEKGAFTNAIARKPGKFEIADGGTLFLDEVGDLPLDAQAKLLRVLQDSKVERVGSTSSIPVDVRLVAATNRDLEHAVDDGAFRADLYFRLSVFPIELPPLRHRASDIALLAQHFLRDFARRLGRPARRLSKAAETRLLAYAWPGNVRELQNVMERAVILSPGSDVAADAIWLPRHRMLAPRDEGGVTTLAESRSPRHPGRARCGGLEDQRAGAARPNAWARSRRPCTRR